MFNIFGKFKKEKEVDDNIDISGVDTVKSKLITYPHGFSTRNGGVSQGIFSSLNLGMNRGDDEDKVKENYKRFLKSCGIKTESFVCGKQVHGNNVMMVYKEDARPAYGYDELFEADGYVTNIPGVPLAVFTADCIPLLLADEESGVIAAVHCGWRSTVADIQHNAIEKMIVLGAEYDNIKACIGPAIERCCFEVGDDVIAGVENLLSGMTYGLYDKKENGKYMLDLKGALKRSLINSGLLEANIEIINECTMCSPDKYWSHRYTKGERGSQASIIMIP